MSTTPDTFEENVEVTSGPLNGGYLWSNASNWSNGVPVIADAVSVATGFSHYSYDDIASLDLSSLTLTNESLVDVVGSALTVTTVAGSFDSQLVADAGLGTPVTVTVGTITGSGGTYYAFETGARFIDESATDTGNTYYVDLGGFFELSAAPNSSSDLQYLDRGPGTFALNDPGLTNTALTYALVGVGDGDVLELPGTSVSNVTFGTNSLDVTTTAGTYDFTNVTYSGTVSGYVAALDPTTGLVAITFGGPDTFEENVEVTSGPLNGGYLWSNASNWSNGVPVIADAVSVATGFSHYSYDDIASLDLSSLTLTNESLVDVVGSALTVTTVAGSFDSQLVADAGLGTPVTVTVGTITGSGGTYYAFETGARFIDESATDTGNTYYVDLGGFFELSAAPNSSSDLQYLDRGPGTFALNDPGLTNTALTYALLNLGVGDVLELPGTSVSNVTFGTNSLDVTTTAGTYDFTNVTYSGTVSGYVAALDPTTGLVAITFGGPDTFEENVEVTSGPLNGGYLWSNASNWSNGVPVIADAVSVATGFSHYSYDDIASLDLSSLTLTNESLVDVVGSALTVTTVAGSFDSQLVADAGLGTPVTVTVGTITGSGGTYYAFETGARFIDESATDTGNTYYVDLGGFFELSAAPNSSSDLQYLDRGPGTFALNDPGLTNTALTYALVGVGDGDVLELPGTSVSNVTFGTNSLDVTTTAGTYDFTNVTYSGTVSGYVAALDPTTGLVAITFGGPDTFEENVEVTSGPLNGGYLWSNASNWSNGVPVIADAVSVATGFSHYSYDDIASLDLGSLTLSGAGYVDVVGSELTVTTIAATTGSVFIADAATFGTPVTVTVGTITGSGADYAAAGAGARFVDQSTTDTGNSYLALAGGFVELSAAPASGSILQYGTGLFSGDSTFALKAVGTTNAVALQNVSAGDVLELPGQQVENVTFGTNSLDVTVRNGPFQLTHDFTNVTYSGTVSSYVASLDTSTGLVAITFLACFLAGTRILTEAGEVVIEDLTVGDQVITVSGEPYPIKWIGRQTVSTRFADPLRILPIRIKAGALGKNIPFCDLLVSPDHAILIDDVLVQAGALVNDTAIVRETHVPETFTYYHIELDDHSLILAESTPAETFVDNVDRMAFDNWDEYQALYPEGKSIVEMPYPRAKAHRQVPRAIRERLAERAAMLTSKTQSVAA